MGGIIELKDVTKIYSTKDTPEGASRIVKIADGRIIES